MTRYDAAVYSALGALPGGGLYVVGAYGSIGIDGAYSADDSLARDGVIDLLQILSLIAYIATLTFLPC